MVGILYRRALAAAILAALAILGLLIGRWLSAAHVLRWSAVSILYGITVPDVILLLITLIVPVLLQLYLTSLRFDESIPPDLGETPKRSA